MFIIWCYLERCPRQHPTIMSLLLGRQQRKAARENCSTFNNDEDVIQGGNSATSIFQATN